MSGLDIIVKFLEDAKENFFAAARHGLKAQLNTPQAVKALTFAVSVINAEGGWNKFKAYRDTFDFFGKQNPLVKDQLGFWPMESLACRDNAASKSMSRWACGARISRW